MIPQPYINSDKNSFANTSLLKRWPSIIDGAVKDLESVAAKLPDGAKKDESKKLMRKFEDVKTALARNDVLVPFGPEIRDSSVWKEALPEGLRWADAPWLLSECYLYRWMQVIIEDSQHWKTYDMFEKIKNETFEKSSDAISKIAQRYHAITTQLSADEKVSKEALEVLFHELMASDLWGNATDLSLLVTVSLEDLKKLQVEADNRDKETLLVNDFGKVWKQVSSEAGGRIDIVLDNSGFELYTDLILALFFLDSGLAEQVVLHPKNQPWFVSDVVPKDFSSVLSMLGNASVFPNQRDALDFVVSRLTHYTNEGQLFLRTSPFWTTPLPFWEIHEGGQGGGDAVWRDLRGSKLVIFKGDLNYRKLTGDVMWPRTTPFRQAIGGIATSGIPFVTLRTVKADVCVGLAEGQEAELEKTWTAGHPGENPEAWAWSGSYAVVNFNK